MKRIFAMLLCAVMLMSVMVFPAAAIVANNDATVDAVAGATLTSNRIMNAVAQCLEAAAK